MPPPTAILTGSMQMARFTTWKASSAVNWSAMAARRGMPASVSRERLAGGGPPAQPGQRARPLTTSSSIR